MDKGPAPVAASRASYERIVVGVTLAFIVAAFLITRSLSTAPLTFLVLDGPIYLALAARLPHYTLWDHVAYVNHPPMFPFWIRVASLALPPHLAGMAVVLLMEVAAGMALWWAGRRVGLGYAAILTMLALLTLNIQWHSSAATILKESTFAAFALIWLVAWAAAIRGGRRALAVAVAGACATVATSDHALFVLAGGQAGIAAWALTERRWHRRLVLPAVAATVLYAVWLAWRLHAYRSGTEAAVGIDGILEPTTHIGLRQLVSPQALPHSSALTGVISSRPTLGELRTLANQVFAFAPVFWGAGRGWWRPPALLPGTVLAIAGGVGLAWAAWRGPTPAHRGLGRACLVLLAFFCIPASQALVRAQPRMFILWPVITALGCALLVDAGVRRRPRAGAAFCATLCLGMVGTVVVTARLRPYITWTRPVRVEAQLLADWFRPQPPGGIMVQVGYGPELAYLLPNRPVQALPLEPDLLDRQLREHRIRYIAYGTHYWRSPESRVPVPLVNSRVLEYIRERPERYPLLIRIDDAYDRPVRGLTGDTYWVHGVRDYAGEPGAP